MDPTTQVLLDSLERGFKGVHSRLDTLNGKVYKHEHDIAVLEHHTNQLLDQAQQLEEMVETLVKLQHERQAIVTRQSRDLKMVAAVLGGLMGLASFIAQVKPELLSWVF